MQIKTVNTTAAVSAIEFDPTSDFYFWVKNIGDGVVYAANFENITAGADGVAMIPAGEGALIESYNAKIYVMGTSTVEVRAQNTPVCFFKSAAQGGGEGGSSGVGENLLINPDFAINQRGIYGNPIYSAAADADNYTFDRWFLDGTGSNFMYYQTSGAPSFGWTNSFGGTEGRVSQIIEADVGENYSISYDIRDKSTGEINPDYIRCEFDPETKKFSIVSTGNNKYVLINWVKLERGAKVTPYVSPDPTEELQKCSCYYEVLTYDTDTYVPCVQYSRTLNSVLAVVWYSHKRIVNPTVAVENYGGWRAVLMSGTNPNITSAIASKSNANNVGIVFTVNTATTTPSAGWVDRFKVKIDAEIR